MGSKVATASNPSASLGSETIVSARPRRVALSKEEHRRLAHGRNARRELTAWGFLGPMFLFFCVFLVIPTVGVVWWSMQSGGMVTGSTFVGLNNFITLPDEVTAGAAIANTLTFALMSIPPALILALLIAMVLARVKHGGAVYRFLVYLPVLVPGVVAALIWIFLTNIDFGLFNTVLQVVGLPHQVWLSVGNALPVLAALDVWRNVGYWTIFFYAAVIGLPEELFQAAALDGANALRRFRHLTLPLLRPMIMFAIIIATIWGLQIFDTPLILTDGGPGTATTTVILQVWRYALSASGQVGLAAAISLALLVAILALTAVQLRLLRGRGGT